MNGYDIGMHVAKVSTAVELERGGSLTGWGDIAGPKGMMRPTLLVIEFSGAPGGESRDCEIRVLGVPVLKDGRAGTSRHEVGWFLEMPAGELPAAGDDDDMPEWVLAAARFALRYAPDAAIEIRSEPMNEKAGVAVR